MDRSDSDLLAACAAGDRDAYGLFVRRHSAAVLRFCLLQLGEAHGAEDAAQEALLRLYAQVGEGRVPEAPLPWLLAIARRCCQESQRQRRRHQAEELPREGPAAGSESGQRANGPDLPRALTALNDFEAALLHLKHTEGLSCQQIGRRLGKPVGTVTAALSRAYAKLRAELRKDASR
jgi:RNA polymerase sigma-70 factor, ECF subfamily